VVIPRLKKSIALPSSIRRIAAYGRPQTSVGVALDRQRVTAVGVVRTRADTRVEWLRTTELARPMFGGVSGAVDVDELSRVLTDMGVGFARRYVPVHVALPDALLRFSVLALDALPKTERLRADVARLQTARDSVHSPVEWATQPLGEENGKQLLFAVGVDARCLRGVNDALEQAGIVPWSVNAGMRYRFNRFHDQLTADNKSGALVSIDGACWSLALWDDLGRLRYARGRWLREPDASDTHAVVAADVQRAVLAYVQQGDRKVERIAVTGEAASAAVLGEMLDRRLHGNCLVLHAGQGLEVSETLHRDVACAPIAMAAAVAA
jgi:hypothetical protein